MWYPLGQALLYVIIGIAVIVIFAVPLSRYAGRIVAYFQQSKKDMTHAFHAGREQHEEDEK